MVLITIRTALRLCENSGLRKVHLSTIMIARVFRPVARSTSKWLFVLSIIWNSVLSNQYLTLWPSPSFTSFFVATGLFHARSLSMNNSEVYSSCHPCACCAHLLLRTCCWWWCCSPWVGRYSRVGYRVPPQYSPVRWASSHCGNWTPQGYDFRGALSVLTTFYSQIEVAKGNFKGEWNFVPTFGLRESLLGEYFCGICKWKVHTYT